MKWKGEKKKTLSLMVTSIYLTIQDKWVKWQKILEAGKTANRKIKERDKCESMWWWWRWNLGVLWNCERPIRGQWRISGKRKGVSRTKAILIHISWGKRRSPHLPALYPMLTETSRGLVKGMTPIQFYQEVEASPIYFIEAKLKGKTNLEQ